MENVNIDNKKSSNILLRVDDLHKNFYTKSRGKKVTTFALRGVSFSINEGEAIAVVGESGCGKSTLARIIAGLDEPTRGALTFESNKLIYNKQIRKKISMVFQDPYASLNPRMTVNEIVKEPMHLLKDLDKSEKNKLVLDLLQLVNLNSELTNRYPFEFSGGQRQRIGIARALATDPDLIILDEPVSALDVSVQAGVINLLKKLRLNRNLTMLFISHDLRVVRHLCDRTIVMYLGQIMEIATTKALFEHPRHPYTRALIASIPTPNFDLVEPAVVSQDSDGDIVQERLIKGELPSPNDPPEGCPFKTRCEKATEQCDIKPPLAKMNDGRLISCHFPD
jgi:oligopeptide/dipeptide ABC transporter ATP-binding protein